VSANGGHRGGFGPGSLQSSRKLLNLILDQVFASPLCAGESCSHLFFSCSMARNITTKLARWWEFDCPDLFSYDDWLEWFHTLRLLKGFKDILKGFNSVGNGKIKGDGFGMLDEIDSCAGLWGLGSKSKKEWVKELSNNNKLNFIAIQETKMEKVSHMDVKFMWGSKNSIVSDLHDMITVGTKWAIDSSVADLRASMCPHDEIRLACVDLVNKSLGLGRKKKKALFFKVDFAKAYDSVRWDFLLDVLEAFGFGSTWCTWIRAVHGIRLISFSRKVSIWSSILKEVQCLSQSGFDFLSYCSRTYRYGQSTSLGKDLG
ncbi:hypothetical protein Tco_0105955, partial [Tanacetum coccineum]